MLRHLLTAGSAMAVGFGVLAYVHHRWGDGERSMRRFAIGFVIVLAVIAGVSAGSESYQVRCPDDPAEWCEYNDSVAAMATIAAVYVVASVVRSWMIYAER